MAKSTAILAPNLGLFTTCDPLEVPDGAVQAGMNFRIRDGKLNNLNIGWAELVPGMTLNGAVVLCERMYHAEVEELLFMTPTDLYFVDPVAGTEKYITPQYATGTAGVVTNAVTGVGTAFNTVNAQGRKNVVAGDYIAFAAGVIDPAASWYKVTAVTDDTHLTITGHVGTVSAAAYTIRQCFTNAIHQKWSVDIFTNAASEGIDLWMATNGLDPILQWNGTDPTAQWSPATFRAKKLRVFKNMMIYAAITEDGTFKPASMINSGVGDPNDFTDDSISGEFVVGQGVEEIIRLELIGDNLVAYRNGASNTGKAALIQFVGTPVQFMFRDVLLGIGPLGGGYIANFGNYHEFASRDGQYRFDGVNAVLCGQQIWRSILSTLDPARNDMAFTHFNQEAGEVVWAVPLTTDADVGDQNGPMVTAYVEGYLEVLPTGRDKPWSVRDFPFLSAGYTTRSGQFTWDKVAGTWKESNFRWNDQFFFADFPLSICGDSAGKVWILDGSQLGANVNSLPSQVVMGRRSLGDGRMRALLRRIYPFVQKFVGTMSVQTQLSEHASGPITTIDTQPFDMSLPEGGHFVSPFRRGRFFQLAFGTAGNPWSLSGYDTDLSPGGKR